MLPRKFREAVQLDTGGTSTFDVVVWARMVVELYCVARFGPDRQGRNRRQEDRVSRIYDRCHKCKDKERPMPAPAAMAAPEYTLQSTQEAK